MLGHYDAGFTLRTYTYVTRQMQQKAAEKMGRASWRRFDKSHRQAEHRKGSNFLSGALWLFPRISLYPWGMSWQ